MSSIAASIGAKTVSGAAGVPRVLQTKDGRIQVEACVNSLQGDDVSLPANVRFQSNRTLLLTAVSLATLMGAVPAAAQDGAGVQLPTIDVTGSETGGYQATQQSITRLPTPLLDTPQTVNVVPQQVIRDQRATSMEDALRNVPGITFSAGEGGVQADAPFIRGFTARGDIFRDGVRDPGWYTRDLFNVDRVEVYKGPSSFAFGRGATGGAINNASKLPTGETFVDTTLTATTGPGIRFEGDASGKNGNVSGRIAALYQDVDTPNRDHVNTKRWGVAPSVKFGLGDITSATLSYIYQGEQSVPDYGHPWLPAPTTNAATGARTGGYNGDGSAVTPVPVARSNWYGFTSGNLRDLVETNTHILTGKIEHAFSEALKLTNTTRYVSVTRMARPTAPRTLQTAGGSTVIPAGASMAGLTIGQQHFQTDTDNSMLLNQTDLTAKFNTFGLQHTLAAGVELAQEKRWQQRANLCSPTGAGACRTDLSNPTGAGAGGVFAGFNPSNDTTQNTVAVYLSDQIKLNKYFELLGALRYDSFKTDYAPGAPADTVSRSDNLLSYRFGGVFHPVQNASLYVSYGNSYNPSAELGTLSSAPTATNSSLLDPEKNVSYEAGAKWDVLGGRLSLTGAIFRVEKTNLRVPNDPLAATVIVLDGLARVDGIELGVAGKITDKWNVSVGYSHLRSEVVRTTQLDRLGNQLPNTPPNNFTFWSTYDVTPQFTVGGGAFYQDKAFANDTNTLYVPAYWRFDAMASYKIDAKTTLQLNVYNLTDEFYYAQYYGGHAVPASGRYAALSLSRRW